jgi:hypothetical protein
MYYKYEKEKKVKKKFCLGPSLKRMHAQGWVGHRFQGAFLVVTAGLESGDDVPIETGTVHTWYYSRTVQYTPGRQCGVHSEGAARKARINT